MELMHIPFEQGRLGEEGSRDYEDDDSGQDDDFDDARFSFPLGERESSLLTTYWSESTLSS